MVIDKCKNCGKEVAYYPGRIKKYCSLQCRDIAFKGYRHSDESKNKMKAWIRPKLIETQEQKRKRLSEHTRQYREKHSDRVKEQRLKQYIARKHKAFLVIGGAICRRCGCDEISFLEFNHKEGNGCKEHRANNGTSIMDRILTKKRNTEDLECLCRVCNALDYLERKNPDSASKYMITYTGKKAELINGKTRTKA